MSELPWIERVTMISIHPDAATRDDVARMVAELVDALNERDRLRALCREAGKIIQQMLAIPADELTAAEWRTRLDATMALLARLREAGVMP